MSVGNMTERRQIGLNGFGQRPSDTRHRPPLLHRQAPRQELLARREKLNGRRSRGVIGPAVQRRFCDPVEECDAFGAKSLQGGIRVARKVDLESARLRLLEQFIRQHDAIHNARKKLARVGVAV